MILTILSMLIIGLLGVLIGMIIESSFENANIKEPEQETIKVIEINDHREHKNDQNRSENYFEPF